MSDRAICPLHGASSYFVEGPEGQPHYAYGRCEHCIQDEAEARDAVADCEHAPRQYGPYVVCVLCGGMRCQDGTWLHVFTLPRRGSPLEAA